MTDDRSQRERMLAGDLYLAADPELHRARRLQNDYNRTGADDDDERRRLLHELLGAVGTGTVEAAEPITIGANRPPDPTLPPCAAAPSSPLRS